jgi:hypothetical protein
MLLWEVFDEFGEPCQAILTHDVVNAPHKFTFGARKVTRMNAPILLATEAVHPAQGPEQYEASCATVTTQIKKWGCKITTVQEITDRLDNYQGANIEKKTDVQYRRGALRRSFPPVPQAFGHASPTSQAPSPQSGFNPLGQHSAGMAQSPPSVGEPVAPQPESASVVVAPFTAANLSAFTVNTGGQSGDLVHPSSPAASEAVTEMSARSKPQFGRASSGTFDSQSVISLSKEKMSKGMQGMQKFEWKLKQLDFYSAGSGQSAFGRERRFATDYSKEADALLEHKMADALRQKRSRHEDIENLANGDFNSREIGALRTDVGVIATYFTDWNEYSQQLWTKRDIADHAANASESDGDVKCLLKKIVSWPLPTDTPGAKWDPNNPAVRHMTISIEEKFHLFLELLSEHLISPMVNQGEASKPKLLKLLNLMKDEVNATSLVMEDDTHDDVFEAALGRIRATGVLVSREHGFLGGSKADAEQLKADASEGKNGIYHAFEKKRLL